MKKIKKTSPQKSNKVSTYSRGPKDHFMIVLPPECHKVGTRHDTQYSHTIQTQEWPVLVSFIIMLKAKPYITT